MADREPSASVFLYLCSGAFESCFCITLLLCSGDARMGMRRLLLTVASHCSIWSFTEVGTGSGVAANDCSRCSLFCHPHFLPWGDLEEIFYRLHRTFNFVVTLL